MEVLSFCRKLWNILGILIYREESRRSRVRGLLANVFVTALSALFIWLSVAVFG